VRGFTISAAIRLTHCGISTAQMPPGAGNTDNKKGCEEIHSLFINHFGRFISFCEAANRQDQADTSLLAQGLLQVHRYN